jgi:uncharacterized protein (TIGR03067 family)
MRCRTLWAALAAALGLWALGYLGSSTGLRAAEPGEEEAEALQGTWKIESFTLDGLLLGTEQIKNWKRTVTDRHVVWQNGAQTILETDFKFDAKQNPKTLDSTVTTGDAKGQTMLAIYELNDGVLRVCFAHPGKPRPTEFSSTPGSGRSLFTAKRVEP